MAVVSCGAIVARYICRCMISIRRGVGDIMDEKSIVCIGEFLVLIMGDFRKNDGCQ